jgi:heterodisulfide reductase subunit C
MATAKSYALENISGEYIKDLSKQPISSCYQCQKCTNGCPMSFAMDIFPHQVMHRIQLDMIDELINSDTIWVCASCETCTARCPNDIDIAHIMDTLRHISIKRGVKPSQKQALVFHKAFLSNVKNLGKMHEMTVAIDYTLKSVGLNGLLKQSQYGMNMILKGKMKLLPHRSASAKEVKDIFRESEEKKSL